MAIAPITGINLKGNNVAFGSEEKSKDTVVTRAPKYASKMVTIPVAVLMALSPSLLEAQSNKNSYNNYNEGENVELLAMASPQQTSSTVKRKKPVSGEAYIPKIVNGKRPTINQLRNKLPYYDSDLGSSQLLLTKPAIGNGQQYHLVFTQIYSKIYPNKVSDIHLIEDGYYCNEKENEMDKMKSPPHITRLIYHNLGGKDDFLGVEVREQFYSEKEKAPVVQVYEVKLDDETANVLIDYVTGNSQFEIDKEIPVNETHTKRLMPVKLINLWDEYIK